MSNAKFYFSQRRRDAENAEKKIGTNLLLIALAILSLTTCSRNSDWVQFRGEGGRGVSSSRITPPLGLRWKINLQANDETIRSLNPPVVIGDTIYFGSDDGNFYALDVESGFMRWVFKSGAEINSIPYADKDKVYFGSKDGRLYALSRETGEVEWTFQTMSQINSQVQRYGDYIIFVGDADAFYFLSPDGIEQFRIINPGWYNYTFLIADGVIYMATGPQTELIGPFDIHKRDFLWFLNYRDLDAWWYSFSAVRGDLLYFGTADLFTNFRLTNISRGIRFGFHAYNRHTGELVWQQYKEGVLDSIYTEDLWNFLMRYFDILDFMAPTIWRDLVIFTGGDNVARAFDANTGSLRWERYFNTPISSAPTIADGRVYFGLLGDYFNPPQLICISARDGKLLWQMETEGAILSAPVIAGKRVIFGTDKNIFYVLEQVF
ncbi:MAG: PQQ-binding-like beta-propeller repeat protein [Treponema sp.]|jgi:outer membrane protein assembly factor BamB|nr:PQQ-binding-like beta-propeller repeat protein [Treponema sp.]